MREFLVMFPDIFPANGIEVIHRRVQADGAGNVRGPGLEPVRRGFEFRLVVADA